MKRTIETRTHHNIMSFKTLHATVCCIVSCIVLLVYSATMKQFRWSIVQFSSVTEAHVSAGPHSSVWEVRGSEQPRNKHNFATWINLDDCQVPSQLWPQTDAKWSKQASMKKAKRCDYSLQMDALDCKNCVQYCKICAQLILVSKWSVTERADRKSKSKQANQWLMRIFTNWDKMKYRIIGLPCFDVTYYV